MEDIIGSKTFRCALNHEGVLKHHSIYVTEMFFSFPGTYFEYNSLVHSGHLQFWAQYVVI